jgi:hypothetical protein
MSRWRASKAARVRAALDRIGWETKRESKGSHVVLAREGWPDFPGSSRTLCSLGFVTVRDSKAGEVMAESDDDLRNELARLKAENEALKAKEKRGTRLQVSEKGGVSLYGMRRFPVTFYREEWERILDMADEIRAFIRENAAKLKTKSREE